MGEVKCEFCAAQAAGEFHASAEFDDAAWYQYSHSNSRDHCLEVDPSLENSPKEDSNGASSRKRKTGKQQHDEGEQKKLRQLSLTPEEHALLKALPKVHGVSWDSSLHRWMAHMPSGHAGPKSKSFTVRKFGMAEGWERAVKCRLEAQTVVDVQVAGLVMSDTLDPAAVSAALKALPSRPKGVGFDRSSNRWLVKYQDPETGGLKYKSFNLKTHGNFFACYCKALTFQRQVDVEAKRISLERAVLGQQSGESEREEGRRLSRATPDSPVTVLSSEGDKEEVVDEEALIFQQQERDTGN